MKRKISVWLILLLLLLLTACGGKTADKDGTLENHSSMEEKTITDADTDAEQKTPDSPQPANPNEESLPVQSEDFIEEVQLALDGAVGQDEKITNVEKDGDNLIIKVDLSELTDTQNIPLSIIAESRCSSITDAILELEKDEQWETITIDFGDLGSATCSKGDIEENEYGRYISSEVFMDSLK